MLYGIFCGRYSVSKQNFYVVHDKYKEFYSVDEWKYDVTNIILYPNIIRVRSVTLSVLFGTYIVFWKIYDDIDILLLNKKNQ